VAHSVVQVLLNLGEGGMEAMAVNLSLALRQRGHRVTVIALDAGGRHEQTLHERGIPSHVLGGRRFSDIRKHRALAWTLRGADADVVHTHHFSPLLHTMVAASSAGWLPIVHTEHSYQYLEGRPDYRLALWGMSFRCRRVVLVGQAMLPYYRARVRIPEARLEVIPNGVSQPTGSNGDRKAARAALGLPDGHLVVSAGRLFPVKRYEDLLAATALARKSIEGLHLVLLGDGPERQRLGSLTRELGLGDIVHFPGWREDAARWIACADAFVLTSRSEGLPMAALEAMALGIPIIATSVGDLPEVLRGGEAGILVPVGAPQDVANAIVRLARDPLAAARVGRAGRTRVAQAYSQDAMVDAYTALYGRNGRAPVGLSGGERLA
jgi:glycosyltransferase involved in cell wall biosynthesis